MKTEEKINLTDGVDRFNECISKARAITEILGAVNDQRNLSDCSMANAAWAASDFLGEAAQIFEQVWIGKVKA